MDETNKKAPLNSPALTGTPTTPTAPKGTNNTQIASTAYVMAAIAALVDSSPDALNTLNELAAALGNDPNFATTMTNALAGKMDKAANGTDIADVSEFLKNLGLGEGSALPVGVPVPWPSATPPTGWLKCNGAAFSAEEYPELAKAYPTNKLPDLRGEFIRGWDDGRGVDSGRALLSAQSDTLQNITGSFLDMTTGPNNNTVGAFTSSTLTPNLASIATGGTYKQANYYFDASRVARTSTETRARNIAFNFIVRAA